MGLVSAVASAAASSESGRVSASQRNENVAMGRAAGRGDKVTRQPAGRSLTHACRRRAQAPSCSEVQAWRIITPCTQPSRLWARA